MEPLLALEGTSVLVQGAVLIQDVDELEVVALAELVVVEVVCRGKLDGTGTELRINIVVRNDREQAGGLLVDMTKRGRGPCCRIN
jgi:hypothetical protein